MSEKLPSRNYAAEFTHGTQAETKEQLQELKQTFEVMSPSELAAAMVDFIRASNGMLNHEMQYLLKKSGYDQTARKQSIAAALEIGREIAIEQYRAARDLGEDGEDYWIIADAARFERELLINPDFHPVTIPGSCDRIFAIAQQNDNTHL